MTKKLETLLLKVKLKAIADNNYRLASLLDKAGYLEHSDIIACADETRIYFGEKLVNFSFEDAYFIANHEIMHILYRHEKTGKGKDFELYNIAADLIINERVQYMYSDYFSKIPKGGVTRDKFSEPITETYVEGVYKHLLKMKEEKQKIQGSQWGQKEQNKLNGNDDNEDLEHIKEKIKDFFKNPDDVEKIAKKLFEDKKKNKEIKEKAKPLSEEEKEELKDLVRELIQDSVEKIKDKGSFADREELKDFAYEEIKQTPLTWYKLLENYIGTYIKHTHERSFSRPSRRQGSVSGGIILPGNKKTIFQPVVIIYIDVSGSMGSLPQTILSRLEQIKNELEKYYAKYKAISDYVADINMKTKKYSTSGGGINMSVVINDLSRQQFDVAVVITDGADVNASESVNKLQNFKKPMIVLTTEDIKNTEYKNIKNPYIRFELVKF